MERKETKEYFEKKDNYHQVAMMEFTDLLKQEYNVDSDKIPSCFYDVLGIVLTRFEKRINSKTKKPCSKCDGKGEGRSASKGLDGYDLEDCPRCKGQGFIKS